MGTYDLEEINGWIIINDECRIRKRDVSYYRVFLSGFSEKDNKYIVRTELLLNGVKEQSYSSKYNTKEEAEKNREDGITSWDEIMGCKQQPPAIKKEASEIL